MITLYKSYRKTCKVISRHIVVTWLQEGNYCETKGERELKIRKLNKKEKIPMDLLLLADPSEKMIHNYLKQGVCFVGELDGQIIGVFVLSQQEPNIVEIMNIAVDEDYQGKGIGKQLIHHAIKSAREEAYQTIEIGTGNSSIGQLTLYQKCGFRIVGIDRDFFVRNYPEPIYENGIHCRDMIRLVKEL